MSHSIEGQFSASPDPIIRVDDPVEASVKLSSETSPPSKSGLDRVANTLIAFFDRPLVGLVITAGLLWFCTWGLVHLRAVTGIQRSYTILYLIPVAIAAALLGLRGGILAALVCLILSRIFLFNDNKQGLDLLSIPDLTENIEFAALAAGTITIAAVTGRLRSTLGLLKASHLTLKVTNHELEQANERLVESEKARREFNRDVLLAVTSGKLQLMEIDEWEQSPLFTQPPSLRAKLTEPRDATLLRQSLQELAEKKNMRLDRIADLCTAATEAATNAIKHGNGGSARVWSQPDGMFVVIEDSGDGIAPAHLARATLEKGYSTRISLGMGFHLMLETVDRLSLCTGGQGTIIVLNVTNTERLSESDVLLAKYLGS